MANRLKKILPDIIGETQCVFVPQRIMTDNAFIAFECFHYMKNKNPWKHRFMRLKLDMSKAYDRVE